MIELRLLKELILIKQVDNGYHDVLMMSMNLSNMAILYIHGADYCCIINRVSKSEAVNLLQKADLNEKKWNIINYKNYKKISKHM